MPTHAVLFDFDGVIADTENVHIAAWQRTFGAMGWLESDEVCARAAEVDDRAFVAEVFARRKVEGDVEGWVARKQVLTLRLLADSPRLYPGIAELVRALEGKVRLGVVTTTWRANVQAVLEASSLAGAFEFIVAKEDVKSPKPDSEGYRLALANLELTGAEVVALEDSPGGLESSRKADIRVIAIGHRRPEPNWAGGAPFLPNFANLAKTLDLLDVTA
jgi:beta-phosphoglucomutase